MLIVQGFGGLGGSRHSTKYISSPQIFCGTSGLQPSPVVEMTSKSAPPGTVTQTLGLVNGLGVGHDTSYMTRSPTVGSGLSCVMVHSPVAVSGSCNGQAPTLPTHSPQ